VDRLADLAAAALFGLRRLLRRHWPAVPLLLLLAYLVHALIWGDRGLLALRAGERELAAERAAVAALRAERERLSARVKALEGPEVDADLVESELRRLGWVRRDEMVILDGGADGPHAERTGP